MQTTQTFTGRWTRLHKPEIGGRFLAALMAADFYPLKEEEAPYVATSVRLPEDLHAKVLFLAKLWNRFDEARGIERRRSWKAAAVIERLVTTGVAQFSEQIKGWPETEEAKRAMLKDADALAKELEAIYKEPDAPAKKLKSEGASKK